MGTTGYKLWKLLLKTSCLPKTCIAIGKTCYLASRLINRKETAYTSSTLKQGDRIPSRLKRNPISVRIYWPHSYAPNWNACTLEEARKNLICCVKLNYFEFNTGIDARVCEVRILWRSRRQKEANHAIPYEMVSGEKKTCSPYPCSRCIAKLILPRFFSLNVTHVGRWWISV